MKKKPILVWLTKTIIDALRTEKHELERILKEDNPIIEREKNIKKALLEIDYYLKCQ